MPAPLRRPAFVAVATVAAIGVGLTFWPLFDLPGFELSSALTLLCAFLAPCLGFSAAERLKARASPTAMLQAWARACLLSLAAVLPPIAFAWLTAALGDTCRASTGIGFALLLPPPTALCGAAIGLCLQRWIGHRARALLVATPLLALSLAVTLWPLWDGPQIFALHHLLGYFPGPIYDEALSVDARLIAFRALTLVWTSAFLFLAALKSLDGWRERLRSRLGRALAACLIAIALFWRFDGALGLRTTEEDIDAILGGRVETPHLTIHFPREKSPQQARRLAFEMAFASRELADFFGVEPKARLHAFFHRGPEEKRRLTGASRTDFAKPWRGQFHALDRPWPHPTARHELAHLFGADFGTPVFGVSWSGLVGLNIGLVEGLAVAAEDDGASTFGLHEQARLMREQGRLPDIGAILEPLGFYAHAGARSYTAVGSFLRFIHERHGALALRALYPAGDFEAATGKTLKTLVDEWHGFLDSLSPSAQAQSAAQQRFRAGGLFQRPCVREIADLEKEARALSGSDPARARELYERCSSIVPEDPGYLSRRAELSLQLDDLDGAATLYEAITRLDTAAPHLRGRAKIALARIAWLEGDLRRARATLDEALDLPLMPGDERSALIQRQAIDDDSARETLRRYFDKSSGLAELLALQRLSDARPDWAIGPYLIGRQLWLRGQNTDALPFLRRAHVAGLTHPALIEENLRVWTDAAFWADAKGDFDEAITLWAQQDESVSRRGLDTWRRRRAFRESLPEESALFLSATARR